MLICNVFDIAQYFCGKNFGSIRCIKISPNKTIEGYVGGYITSIIFLLLVSNLFDIGFNILKLSIMYILSVCGGLFASYIKRLYSIKDFSNALGDHGGFLDRFDSSLFTLPLFIFIN